MGISVAAVAKLPSSMSLTGSWLIDLAVWAFVFAYAIGMLAFVAYCVNQIVTGHSHRR